MRFIVRKRTLKPLDNGMKYNITLSIEQRKCSEYHCPYIDQVLLKMLSGIERPSIAYFQQGCLLFGVIIESPIQTEFLKVHVCGLQCSQRDLLFQTGKTHSSFCHFSILLIRFLKDRWVQYTVYNARYDCVKYSIGNKSRALALSVQSLPYYYVCCMGFRRCQCYWCYERGSAFKFGRKSD